MQKLEELIQQVSLQQQHMLLQQQSFSLQMQ